jgi:hypothetical protein
MVVCIDILSFFVEIIWLFTFLLSLEIQVKVVWPNIDREYKDIHPYPSFHHYYQVLKVICKGFVEEVRGFTPLNFEP